MCVNAFSQAKIEYLRMRILKTKQQAQGGDLQENEKTTEITTLEERIEQLRHHLRKINKTIFRWLNANAYFKAKYFIFILIKKSELKKVYAHSQQVFL